MKETSSKGDFSVEQLLARSESSLKCIYDDIVQQLPSRAPIYLPTERVGLVDRILGVQRVRQIYQQDLDAIYRPRLRALREQFRGCKRCFLIGNGPSLNETDLEVLKHEVTFAVNGFFLKSKDLEWTPTFYLIEDHLVAEDRAPWVNAFNGPIKLFPAYLGYAFPQSADTIFYNHRPRKSFPHGFDFSLEADKVTYTGCTVTFSMLQLAAYLGFEEIYLIGVDATYSIPSDAQDGEAYSVGVLDMKSDDPNHFDPDYFGKGFRWHDPQVDKMIEAYQEANRALEGTGQTIYNATIGGALEVFERRNFYSLFPCARSRSDVARENDRLRREKYPRLLIFDMTAMGNGTATGEVKANLLAGWPEDRLLQVARHGAEEIALVAPNGHGDYCSRPTDIETAREAIHDFAPDVILYRPVPKVPRLHGLAMRTIRERGCPLATWIMDDWPEVAAQSGAAEWETLGPDLRELLDRSDLCLSICDAMSDAFARRYGRTFRAFANGVNPVEWPALRHHDGRQLLLRYSGGLAENMRKESVLRIARAVETLARQGYEIEFEISTPKWCYKASKDCFKGLDHTHVDTVTRTPDDYRNWLAAADAVVIAYNDDADTLRYVRYSMANKMPECLASGAVVFAHGPREVATIDYLASTEAAVVVEEPESEAVASALQELMEEPTRRNALARRARKVAFEQHDILTRREELRNALVEAASEAEGVAEANTARPGATRSTGRKILDEIGVPHEADTGAGRQVPARDPNRVVSKSTEAPEAEVGGGTLKEANQLMREGKLRQAMERYLALWEHTSARSSPMVDHYGFNALYAARKQGLRVDTIRELEHKVHAGELGPGAI